MTDATTTGTGTVIARPAPDTLDIHRYFDAPPKLMWRLWTDPDHFARWWGPIGMRCTRCEIDLRVGGKWLATITGKAGTAHTVTGAYREIDTPRCLVFTWQWLNETGPGHESLVTVTIAPEGDGARLRVLHQGLGPGQPESHAEGWRGCLDSLGAEVSAPPA